VSRWTCSSEYTSALSFSELSPFRVCHSRTQRTSTPGSRTENPGGRPELRQGQGKAARAEESGIRTVGGECPSQQLLVRAAQLTTHNAQNVKWKSDMPYAMAGWLLFLFHLAGAICQPLLGASFRTRPRLRSSAAAAAVSAPRGATRCPATSRRAAPGPRAGPPGPAGWRWQAQPGPAGWRWQAQPGRKTGVYKIYKGRIVWGGTKNLISSGGTL
jgi:hypothetical protein